MKRLAIVHTSQALLAPLKAYTDRELPGVDVVNIMDDTTLAYARKHGVDEKLNRRMYLCFQAAAEAGADVILNACSSVGETVDVARKLIDVPILKIDEPMAEEAVVTGRKIAVLATVKSTLDPTCRLVEAKAKEKGIDVEVSPYLKDGVLDLLMAGNTEEHDKQVSETALRAAGENDVVLFAQASMARLEPVLKEQIDKPLLTSPQRAMNQLKEMLGV